MIFTTTIASSNHYIVCWGKKMSSQMMDIISSTNHYFRSRYQLLYVCQPYFCQVVVSCVVDRRSLLQSSIARAIAAFFRTPIRDDTRTVLNIFIQRVYFFYAVFNVEKYSRLQLSFSQDSLSIISEVSKIWGIIFLLFFTNHRWTTQFIHSEVS